MSGIVARLEFNDVPAKPGLADAPRRSRAFAIGRFVPIGERRKLRLMTLA